jgi:RND family efflux transporter MFP subunit
MLYAPWIRAISIALVAMALVSCKEEPPPPAEAVRPVKTIVIDAIGAGGIREFPGRIDANRQAELAFRVRGRVETIHVKEGDQVQEGQLLAELDKTDYQILVNNQQAQFDNAEKNYLRGEELITSGAISRMTFDRMEADYKTAQANLETARQDLAYTTMTAPFGGVIARRHVENFEQVLANQSVFTLQEVDILEVKVDVPERLLRRLRRRAGGDIREEHSARAKVEAFFPQNPATSYPLTFKETATKADPSTQTFEVTFTMPAPEDINVLPGMTVSVRADLTEVIEGDKVVLVPGSAIGASASLDPQVWVVDEDTMTVHPQRVEVGELEGNSIQVLEGLHGGERVVVAGIGALADGMKVTLMQTGEQAEPREGSPRGN